MPIAHLWTRAQSRHPSLCDGDGRLELLVRNEYPAAGNHISRAQPKGRPKLSDADREALGEIGHRLAERFRSTSPSSSGRTRSGPVSRKLAVPTV
jgi:hypothetical protein